ncbi:MAG: hypothetical protein EHM31_13735, partial [Candidatus Aminicenantes bacterium]
LAAGPRPGTVCGPQIRAGRDPGEDRAGPRDRPRGAPGALRPPARQRVLVRGDRRHQEPARGNGQEPRLPGQRAAEKENGGIVTSCPRPEDLYLYVEGELGPYDARKLEEHVECCPACRDALAERRVLHEAFTSLPPFDVPKDFARSVMDRLPEPEVRKARWLAPLVAAVSALAVGLAGFHFFTGLSIFEVLVSVNRFFGSVIAQAAPLAAKAFKIGRVLLEVAGGLMNTGLAGLATFSRVLGPQGITLLIGLGALLSVLAFFGARRFLRQGE